MGKLRRIQPTRIADLKAIKQAIPLVLNLHPSFWDNPKFLRWQLMRLNKYYQKDADDLWWRAWTWIEKEWTAQMGISVNAEMIHLRFPPFPKEIKALYNDHPSHLDFSMLVALLDSLGWESAPCPQESFEDWHIRKGETNLIEIYKRNLSQDDWIVRLISDFLPPYHSDLLMPWTVCFPSFHYLHRLPDWPEQGKLKGRRQNWAFNLLVFELSQAGMKDMGIARLLFEVTKSHNSYEEGLDKNPVLVRISTIKKTVERAVSQAYPLSSCPPSDFT